MNEEKLWVLLSWVLEILGWKWLNGFCMAVGIWHLGKMRSLKKGILWLIALANCYSLSTDFTMFELLTHKIITKLLIPCFPTAGHFTQQHFYGAFVITSQSAGRTVCLWGNGAHFGWPKTFQQSHELRISGQSLARLCENCLWINHLFQQLFLFAL